MNMRTGRKLNANGAACIAFCLVALSASGWAATTPIYKCLDRNLGLLYTDEPCRDGEQLDIRAGEADPAAVAWLERQRNALDQSASQRISDLRAAAPEGKSASRSGYEPVDGRGLDDYGPAYASKSPSRALSSLLPANQNRPRLLCGLAKPHRDPDGWARRPHAKFSASPVLPNRPSGPVSTATARNSLA